MKVPVRLPKKWFEAIGTWNEQVVTWENYVKEEINILQDLGFELEKIASNGDDISDDVKEFKISLESDIWRTGLKMAELKLNGKYEFEDFKQGVQLSIKASNEEVSQQHDWGTFYLIDKDNLEYSDHMDETALTLHDSMIKTHQEFLANDLGITFPVTVDVLIQALSLYMGIDIQGTWLNGSHEIEENKWENNGLTYRDALDDLAFFTNSTIGVFNDVLMFKQVNQDVVDTIDGGEMSLTHESKWGKPNVLNLTREPQHDNYVFPENFTSIPKDERVELVVENNQIIDKKREELAPMLFDQSKDIEYTPFEYTGFGYLTMDYGDYVGFKDKEGNIQHSYVTKLEWSVSSGLTEMLGSELTTRVKEDYVLNTDQRRLGIQTYFLVDQQNGIIRGIVENIEENEQAISKLEMTSEEMGLSVNKIEDDLEDVGNRVSEAEIKIKPESITNTVLNSNDYTSTINQINQKIGDIELSVETQNYYNILDNGSGEEGDYSSWEFETEEDLVFSRNLLTDNNIPAMSGYVSQTEVTDYNITDFPNPVGTVYRRVVFDDRLRYNISLNPNKIYRFKITITNQNRGGVIYMVFVNGVEYNAYPPSYGKEIVADVDAGETNLSIEITDGMRDISSVHIKKGSFLLEEYDPYSEEVRVFEIKEDLTSLAGHKLSFHTNGSATNGKFRIVKDRDYSYSVKRTTGGQNFSVDLLEYDANQNYITSKKYNFNTNERVEKTNLQPFNNATLYVALKYNVTGVSAGNRLELTEAMMNIGEPQEWNAIKDADYVYKWARSELNIQQSLIQSKVSTTDFTGQNIFSIMNQTPEGFELMGEKIRLEGVVTANERFKILLDGSIEAVNAKLSGELTAGKVGDWRIVNGLILSKDNEIEFNSNNKYLRFGDVKLNYLTTSMWDTLRIEGVGNSRPMVDVWNPYNYGDASFSVGNPLEGIQLSVGSSGLGKGMIFLRNRSSKIYGIHDAEGTLYQNKVAVIADVMDIEQIYIGGRLRTISRDNNGFLKAI